jgi:hypothetical protein
MCCASEPFAKAQRLSSDPNEALAFLFLHRSFRARSASARTRSTARCTASPETAMGAYSNEAERVTGRLAGDARLRADREILSTKDLGAWFEHAGHEINAGFTYDKTATSVHSTVDESVRLRGGVCQDFAHILVGLCRFHAIPARYVSGYIFSGQESAILGAEASHAWCEAYLPPFGWVGYDPTNDKRINDTFVKIAAGRDYRDVSPVRGVYKGAPLGVGGELSVNVAMEAFAGQ